MNFFEAIQTRQSVRHFKDQAVPRELIEQCVDAARLAPSAHNSQPWKFVVCDDVYVKDMVAHTTFDKVFSFNKFVPNAPVIIAVVSEKANLATKLGAFISRHKFHLVDLGIAVDHFCLAAHEKGLGTCILGWFSTRKVKRILRIPRRCELHILIALGYSDERKLRTKNRKTLAEILSYNKY